MLMYVWPKLKFTSNSWSYGDVFICHVNNQPPDFLIYEVIELDTIGLNFISYLLYH